MGRDLSAMARAVGLHVIDFTDSQLEEGELQGCREAYSARIEGDFTREMQRRAACKRGFVGGVT